MRIVDTFYFSNGGKGSQAILTAVDARSGKIHWQQRTIEKATFVWADQKLITLDQDGNLMIAHPTPQDFKISAKAPLLTRAVVDAAGTRGHAAVQSRQEDDDGARSGLRKTKNEKRTEISLTFSRHSLCVSLFRQPSRRRYREEGSRCRWWKNVYPCSR
jgi:hypothetical protein